MTTLTRKQQTHELNILYSGRIRLNDEQRQALKDAHNAFRKGALVTTGSSLAGSSIKVETKTEVSAARYQEFGLSSLIVNDIICSRDSIAIGVILKLQALLGVEVVTRKELETAFKSYLDCVYNAN